MDRGTVQVSGTNHLSPLVIGYDTLEHRSAATSRNQQQKLNQYEEIDVSNTPPGKDEKMEGSLSSTVYVHM